MWFCVAGARYCAPCQKWAKREDFLWFPKTMAGVGQLKRIWKDAVSVAGAIQETCSLEIIRDVRRSGHWFLRWVAFWSIRSSVSGRWFYVTGAARCMTWHHFFVASTILQTYGLEKLQNASVRGRQLSFNFPLLKGVSQNCFVFDVANFENSGILAGFLRFWCCQHHKLRKSRRNASFLTLSSSTVGEVSQNCFVFKLADCK